MQYAKGPSPAKPGKQAKLSRTHAPTDLPPADRPMEDLSKFLSRLP